MWFFHLLKKVFKAVLFLCAETDVHFAQGYGEKCRAAVVYKVELGSFRFSYKISHNIAN